MSDTITVPIPSEVIDNSARIVRVRWRDTVPVTERQLQETINDAAYFGYTTMQWDDVGAKGERITLTRIISETGSTLELYETSYHTRIDCARCSIHWAQAYVVIEQDGVTTDPEPLCGTHLGMERERIGRAKRDVGLDIRLHESAPLNIGQH